MKAIICAVNASYIHSSLAGAILLQEARKACEAELLELNINQSLDQSLAALYEAQGDIYLFSCYIWNVDYIRALVSDLKKVRNCIVAVGGPEVSSSPADALCAIPDADFVVEGEAEGSVDRMISMLMANRMPDLYIGNVYSHRTLDKASAPVPFSFSDRPFPYEGLDMSAYENKIIYYETMRGCPHRCSYCLSGADGELRFLALEKIEEELLFFMRNKVPLVKFVDRTFNANPSRAKHIVRFILSHNISTCFHFEVCLDTFDEQLAELFAGAPKGYFQMEAGLQSVNQRTLSDIGRKSDIVKFRKTLHRILENDNVKVHADLIALLPEETLESVFYGFDFLFYLSPHEIQLGFLKILKGTKLHKETEKFGIVPSQSPPYEALKTCHITFAEKTLLKKIAYLCERYYNSGGFRETLSQLTIMHDIAPHVLFTQMADYFTQEGLFLRSLSQKELYAHMDGFLSSYGLEMSSHLAFDYINAVSIFLPPFLKKAVVEVEKQDIYQFLKDHASLVDSFDSLKGKTPKEVAKKTAVYKFRGMFEFEPVLFIDENEETTRPQKKRVVIKNFYSYGLKG
ncbi:MAG: DUF4080 domain-containing protein [Eubacteriaceae bacterium]|jgi:hypothetical protein|nr:DUF4080 domain-containing protein [Eubacteriaceae bacterium]